MKKNILIVVALVLILVIAGLVWYISRSEKKQESQKLITAFHLEKFDAGVEMQPGTKGIETTSFKKGETMGISGEAIAPPNTVLIVRFFDENEKALEGNPVEVTLKGSGGFGMCCFDINKDSGKYMIKVYLDGQEARSFLFEVL